jgi:hypothetical protein
MDGIKTVDDLIKAKGLTAEEQEQLRGVIEECRLREIRITEASEQARRGLEGLSRSFGMITVTIFSVGKAVEELCEELGRLQLKMMPADQFYRE